MNRATFRTACDYTRDVLSDVHDDDLARGTPCDDWNVSQVTGHLADVADALVGLLATGELVMPDRPRPPGPDVVATTLAAIDGLLDALVGLEESTRAETVFQAGTIEFTVHGWDVGSTLDPRHRIPDPLAAAARSLVTSLVRDDTRGENFAAAIELPIAAAPGDELVAFLGRRPTA